MFGIDIGGTKCTVARAGPTGQPDEVRRFPTGSPEETLERIAEVIEAMIPGDDPVFGIACGGPLNEAKGRILSPPNLPDWDDVPVAAFLEQRVGGRALLMNDANAGVLAEQRFGAGRGCNDVAFLTLGTGLGAGIVSGGRLLTGANGNAGEIGHVRLTADGPEGYRKRGSSEGWCSGGGIAGRVADLMAEGRLPQDWPHRDAKGVVEAARAGDKAAREIIEEAGRRLGQALAILVDILNPEVIVLGSLFVRAGDLLAGPMREVLEAEALPQALACCSVLPAELGERLPEHQALAVAQYASPHRQEASDAPVFQRTRAAAPVVELADRLHLPADCRAETLRAVEILGEGLGKGQAVLLCGNGGSAADADHWAGELLKSFEHPRTAPSLPGLDAEWAGRLQRGLRAIPLTGFTGARSAVGNDMGASLDYAQLVASLGRAGDVLVAISTSGNAENVCRAAMTAPAMGMQVVGLTGRDGGRLRRLCTCCIRVPADATADVQELHMPVYHAISRALEAGFFGE